MRKKQKKNNFNIKYTDMHGTCQQSRYDDL